MFSSITSSADRTAPPPQPVPFPAGLSLVKRLKVGETLFIEGEEARFCYLIVSGVVKEFTTLDDGQREISDFYAEGDIVGVSGHKRHMQTAEAVTEASVRRVPQDVLLRNPQNSAELSSYVMGLLVRRIDRSRQRAVMISRKSAHERLAGFLLMLAAESGQSEIAISMSRQDIADYLGLTIETVCRILTDLRKSGAILMPRARLFSIADSDLLKNAAGPDLVMRDTQN